ncbi:MAG: formylglycine-generating enzyme family protein, partial [Polyangiaceae bacterium]|nr:formylglycine-generating enzyme family protein [Polyangiaceae bacterium]
VSFEAGRGISVETNMHNQAMAHPLHRTTPISPTPQNHAKPHAHKLRTHPLPYLILISSAAIALLPNAIKNSTPPTHHHNPPHQSITGNVITLTTPGPTEILFPRSTFVMGSPPAEVRQALEACRNEPMGSECKPDQFSNEQQAHRVTLSPYWIDRTEVTVREYMRCVETSSCALPPYHRGAERFRKPSYPVSLVSWDDARAYCRFVGKDLPTEAQWERAARGRTGRRFPWGNQYASHRANHGAFSLEQSDVSDGFAELAPVGSFPQGNTPEQLADMAGNVSEWTLDNYEDGYEAEPATDPTGPTYGVFKVVRGGSYGTGMPWLRGAARGYFSGSTRVPHIGFRCARSAGIRWSVGR